MARKMKDSGIEWIGEIPEGWEVAPLKRFTSIQTGNTPSKTSDSNYYASTGIPWIKPDNLGYSHSISKTSEHLTSEGALCARIMPPNTVYVCCIGSLGKVGYSSISCACNQQINALIFNDLMFWKYGYYLTIAQESQYLLFGNGNVLQIINSTSQSNIACVLPPLENQHLIACYLDSVCSDIEVLISKTRSSIEEYKKFKQAVITQAVTKGVRGKRNMKNSEVPWIGEIPAEWDIIKSSRIIKTTQNGLSRRDLEKSEGQIILKLKNITSDGKIDYSFLNRITLSQNELNTYALTTGDFLFVRVNGSKSLVGKCAIFEAISEIVAYNDHIIRVKLSNQCYNRFFLWYLYSCCGKAEIDLHTCTAAGQYTISGDGLRDITLVFPPIDEQKEIADYLDAKCAEIDRLIAKKEQLVKELESYKRSLIYEVVTGKREV